MAAGVESEVQKNRGTVSVFTRNGERPSIRWQAACLLVVMTLLAYSAVLSAGFIWDDDAYVINNLHLRSLEGLFTIWSEPGATPQYYPLVFSLFWLQFKLWGLNPFGYHLVNILLHSANALLLWSCLQRLKLPMAFWVAALFALHPVQVESVAWITELKNLLSFFFYLLSLHAYLGFSGTGAAGAGAGRRWFLYTASLGSFLLALFSKTVSGSLPAAILLITWWRTGGVTRREIMRLVPFFALALLLGRQTAKLEVTHVLAQGPEWAFSFADRLLIAGRALWFYAGKLFWPHPLIFNYPRWRIDSGAWWQYLFPLAIVCLLVVLWRLRLRTGRGTLAAVLFFIGTLFPALGFFNVYPMRFSFVADHFQYAAAIGPLLLFCGTVGRLLRLLPQRFRPAESIFFGALMLALTLLTWQQGGIYKSNLTLFSDTIAKNPASWFSYSGRAAYYAESGREDLALADIEKALELKPDEADALHHRAIIRLKNREYPEAFADFDRSIAIRPWRTDYLRNRSVAYRVAGRLDKALADADRLVAMEDYNVQNYLLRASIYASGAEYAKALEDLNRAIKIDPEEFLIYANRGLVYYRQGRLPEAIRDYDMALNLAPDSAETLFNRGLAEAAAGGYVEAKEDISRARMLGYPVSENQMRILLGKEGRQ